MRYSIVIGLLLSAAAVGMGIGCSPSDPAGDRPRQAVSSRPVVTPADFAKALKRGESDPSGAFEGGDKGGVVPKIEVVVSPPIPQDVARMEKRSRERLEWNRRTLQGEYDKVGKKNPKWDKPAREALDLAARMFSRQVDPVVTEADIHGPAKKAVDAGCDDPLILYLFAIRPDRKDSSEQDEEYARRIESAADAMSASAYPPYRRAAALLAAAEFIVSKPGLAEAERGEAERKLDAVLDLLARSAAEETRDEHWEDRWYTTVNSVVEANRKLDDDYKAAYDRVEAKLVKVRGIEALRLTVKGEFLLMWGWEARTKALSPGVTEEQFRTFETRLQEARAALNEAWTLKPDQPHVADIMLAIEKGIGGGDREAMETWFHRAMTADGDDLEACGQKLDWLDPKWHGGNSPAEMLAFGKACGATKNWRAGITLLAVSAHFRYVTMLEPAQGPKYLRSPEVWAEIKSINEEYLKHFPDKDAQRSKYAALCSIAGKHADAHAQFKILGDRLTQWTPSPFIPLESMKEMRDNSARIVTGKPF